MNKLGSSIPIVRILIVSAALALFTGATALATSPVLYLGGLNGTHNCLFTINPATGADTWAVDVELSDGSAANIYNGGLAYDPYMDRLYATGTDAASVSKLYRINLTTGIATEIGPTGLTHWLPYGGLAFDLQTRILYATGEESEYFPKQATYLYTVDTLTGAATPVGVNGSPGTYLYGLGYDPVSGQLYANGSWNWGSYSSLLTVDKATGAATLIGEHGVTVGRQLKYSGLAFHPVTHVLYSQGSVSSSACGLYVVSTSTGAATLVGTFASGNNNTDAGLAFVGNSPTGAEEALPAAPRLYQNHPNPFNPRTTIPFYLSEASAVRVAVYGIDGRMIRELASGVMPAGMSEVSWDGRDAMGRSVASGLYFCRLQAGSFTDVRKMVLLR